MTDQEARNLAQRIPKESIRNASAKVGRTNGRPCIHVRDLDPADKSRSSDTIYTEGEWLAHPLNKRNRPAKHEPDSELIIKEV